MGEKCIVKGTVKINKRENDKKIEAIDQNKFLSEIMFICLSKNINS